MLTLASSETSASIMSSSLGPVNSGPLLVAGQEPPRRSRKDGGDDPQLLRLTGFKEEDIALLKILFDFYDRDRDGNLTVREACLLCTTLGFHPVDHASIRCSDDGRVTFRQMVLSAGFVMGNQTRPGARGGTAKHFFRMAVRNSSHPIPSKQVHRFFQSMGVDIPPAAVERLTETISTTSVPSLKEDDLVEFVEYRRKRLNALSSASQREAPARYA